MVPALLVATAIFIVSSIPGNELAGRVPFGSDKLAHGLAYAVFGASVAYPFMKWKRYVFPLMTLGLVFVIGVVYGISDEIHQMFTPLRTPDPWDVVADGIGTIVGASLFFAVYRRLQKTEVGSAPPPPVP